MLRKYLLLLKKYPLIAAYNAIVYAMVCLKTIRTETNFEIFLMRTLLCGAMAFFLYQISGEKTLASSKNSTWYVIKVAMGFLIFALIIGIFGVFVMANEPIWENIPLQMLIVFLLFLFVGLFEEMAFRAIINDAIIYRFRDKKYVFALSALCSSLLFGVAHIIGLNLSSLLAWLQALAKIISTAVFGLALLILYWKTRNIWACGIVHGMYDFLISISMGIYKTRTLQAEYVVSDDQAGAALIVYGVLTLIELLILFRIWHKIGKNIDFEDIRNNW